MGKSYPSHIELNEAEQVKKEQTSTTSTSSRVPKKVKVVVSSNMHPEQKEVFVGFNGTGYLIQLGVPVEIPYELYEVLINAKIKQTRSDLKSEYYVQRYNVQILEWF